MLFYYEFKKKVRLFENLYLKIIIYKKIVNSD